MTSVRAQKNRGRPRGFRSCRGPFHQGPVPVGKLGEIFLTVSAVEFGVYGTEPCMLHCEIIRMFTEA